MDHILIFRVEPWFSKCGPLTCSLLITRELVGNAHPLVVAQTFWIRKILGWGIAILSFNKLSGEFWCVQKFENSLVEDSPWGWGRGSLRFLSALQMSESVWGGQPVLCSSGLAYAHCLSNWGRCESECQEKWDREMMVALWGAFSELASWLPSGQGSGAPWSSCVQHPSKSIRIPDTSSAMM